MRYVIVCATAMPQINQLVNRTLREGMPRDAVEIYRGRNILAWIGVGGDQINIKAFHQPKGLNKYIYGRLRATKARRSYDNARRLLKLGFGTPEPFAFAEEYRGAKLTESYYFSRQISAQEIRYVEDRPDCRPLLEALAKEMARLHRAGVLIKDFSPGNVLFTYSESEGYTFAYVDLNRIEFGVRSQKRLMDNFKRIVTYPAELEILARAYAKEMEFDPKSTVAEALERQRRYVDGKNRKRELKKRLNKLMRPWER